MKELPKTDSPAERSWAEMALGDLVRERDELGEILASLHAQCIRRKDPRLTRAVGQWEEIVLGINCEIQRKRHSR